MDSQGTSWGLIILPIGDEQFLNFEIGHRFWDRQGGMRVSKKVVFRVIGQVESGYTNLAECPKQPEISGPASVVRFEDQYLPALEGLQSGQLVFIFTWLHQADVTTLTCHPRGDLKRPKRGVFSTRSPNRPNPIGLHKTRIIELRENSLLVHPLEVVAGTPVLDIKPVSYRGLLSAAPGIALKDAEIIFQAGRQGWQKGLFNGFNGNLSLRDGAEMIITCSGAAKGRLQSKDLVRVCLQDLQPLGPGKMSSEAPLHQAVYQSQPQARAIVHTHPVHLLGLDLSSGLDLAQLPLFEAKAYAKVLGTVPPLTPGSRELAEAVAEQAKSRQAIWMARHGLVAWGDSLEAALALSEELESLARIRWLTR